MKNTNWRLIGALGLAVAWGMQACGGASADVGIGPFPTPTVTPDGYGNPTTRDTGSGAPGARGQVNSAVTAITQAGPNGQAFEWVNLAILHNNAKAGENVASYAQANKYSTGPTWAAVSEVADLSNASTGLVAHEFDLWTTGPDTGNRIGLDIVLGDVKAIRQGGKSQTVEGTSAIRIGTANSSPLPKWTTGIEFHGRHGVAMDTSKASTETALRMGEGQSIAMDLNGNIKISYSGGRIKFTNAGQPFFEIDTTTGQHFKNGALQ